ncbi:MAG: ABC transporter substrate-binding protein [Alphaproteobacteria bacterium]|nr:ABC transporter substrate-binding protein [Alphaproteobacteria bacterium]
MNLLSFPRRPVRAAVSVIVLALRRTMDFLPSPRHLALALVAVTVTVPAATRILRMDFLPSRRRLARALVAVIVPVIVLAVSAPAVRAQEGETLRVIVHADLRVLDPVWTTAYIARNHGYMVYDTLFAMDENWQPQPQMLEHYEVSDDGLEWRFRLRDGLQWHDGASVTAADAVASLRRWWRRDSYGQQLRAAAAELVVVGEREFALRLERPFASVPEALGKISSNVPFIMPARVAATDPDTPITSAVGSGPYRFAEDEWIPGVVAVYERNPDYIPRGEPASNAAGGKVANFDRVEWHYVPDANTALAGLQAGEFHFWEQVPSDLAGVIARDERLAVEVTDPLGYQGMLRFNHLHPPFDDVEVRRAALLAFEQPRFLRAAAGDERYWRECFSYFPCGTPFASEAGAGATRYDPAAARAALAATDYDGRAVVLLHPVDIPVLSAFAQVAAEQLRAAGFAVEMAASDWAGVASRRANRGSVEEGGWSMFPTAWVGADVLSPVLAAALNGSGDGAWFGWPEDAELELLRRRFLDAATDAERREVSALVQERAIAVGTHVNLGSYFVPVAWRLDSVAGVIRSPVPFFWELRPSVGSPH